LTEPKFTSAFPVFTIITVSYNSKKTISDTINSVLAQTYPNIEYIIIVGGSTDGTVEIVKSIGRKISKFISEPDKGIYDAINKGIKLATGDIIGILNSDDFFCNDTVIQKIVDAFKVENTDAVIGDVQFVDSKNKSRIFRYYSSKRFHPGKFKFGFMPAHPGFYVKRKFFETLGYYKTDYKIAADYELLIRFLYTNMIRTTYLSMPIVSMRRGGISNKSILSNIILNKEIARACKENGIKTNYLNIYSKYFFKIFEFLGNNGNNKRQKTKGKR
jgi:glycosyltransferase involved in cell wall biosynthesis